MKKVFVYTKELAQSRAIERGLTVVSKGYSKQTGRRVLGVRSQSEENLIHFCQHTPRGFECDGLCKSYEHYGMCVHLGACYNYLAGLSRDERNALLALHKEQPAVVREAEKVAREAAAVEMAVRQPMKYAGSDIEAKLAAQDLMRR